MAYDEARGVVVLFGGRTDLAETWEWDGTDWTQRFPAKVPLGRSEFAMAYDAARQRVVINAGVNSTSSPNQLDDTWEWDGVDWAQRLPIGVPPRRDGHAMVFDSNRRQVVLFGHGTDTWEYAPLDPATASGFGAGCAGSSGVPVIAVAMTGLPWVGSHLVVDFMGTPSSANWTLALGTSRTSWSSAPLPLDLTSLGLRGCSLLVSPDALINGAGPTASFSAPARPSLVGTRFCAQALVLDATANAAGLVVTNGLECRFGAR